jgi:hypothetical protein
MSLICGEKTKHHRVYITPKLSILLVLYCCSVQTYLVLSLYEVLLLSDCRGSKSNIIGSGHRFAFARTQGTVRRMLQSDNLVLCGTAVVTSISSIYV